MNVVSAGSAPTGTRRAIRRGVDLRCDVVAARSDRALSFRVSDVSTEGIFVQTRNAVRTGETVVVCFRPDGVWTGGELMVFAEVARVTTSRQVDDPTVGMGLEFTDLTVGERDQLESWLRTKRGPRPRRRRPVATASVSPVVQKAPAVPHAAAAATRCWR